MQAVFAAKGNLLREEKKGGKAPRSRAGGKPGKIEARPEKKEKRWSKPSFFSPNISLA